MTSIELLLTTLTHLNENPHTNYSVEKYRNGEYTIKAESQNQINDLYLLCHILQLTISPGDKWEFIVG